MRSIINGPSGSIVVTALLIGQLALFLLSLDAGAFLQISAFCTGSSSESIEWLFGLLHLTFIGLFLAGIFSLRIPRLRASYVIALGVALGLLIAQGVLVSNGVLWCDGP